MWINLTKDQLELIKTTVSVTLGKLPAAQEIVTTIEETMERAFCPDNAIWIEKAKDFHQDEGQVEVDEQSDGSALVSDSEDGAYIMAWVWVSNEDAGFTFTCDSCSGTWTIDEKADTGICKDCQRAADAEQDEEGEICDDCDCGGYDCRNRESVE